MLDLKRRRPDVRAYVASLERWLIETLKAFDVVGETREDRVGVWVARPDKPASPLGEMAEDKIAAIGVRVRRWVTLHGVSLNVDPDLTHFSGIVPCGSLKRTMASPASPISAAPRPWRKRTRRCARRSRLCSARPDPASEGRASGCPPTGRNYRPDMGLPIGLPERSRRAFWARLYARRRLLSELAAPFAPAHYALIGERLGYRPNAFFDPELLPRPREHRAKREPRLARALSCPPRAECALPFRRIRPRLVRVAESGLGAEPSPSVPALSRARIAGGKASAAGYRCRIRPRHHARRETALARGGGVPRLRPHAQRGRDGAAAQSARNCGRARIASMPMGDCASNARRATIGAQRPCLRPMRPGVRRSLP